jgi:hypothetical protein
MKNWEVMKDVSYVGIKSMKAKSISEGLTRCRIDRLSRQNPIYEHLKIHKLRKGKSECNLCKSAIAVVKPSSLDKTQLNLDSRVNWKSPSRIKTEPTKTASTKVSKRPFSICYNYKSWSALQKAMESTAKTEAISQIDKIKIVIEKFDDGLRRTKSNFNKLTNYSKRVEDYFLTEIDEIELELN